MKKITTVLLMFLTTLSLTGLTSCGDPKPSSSVSSSEIEATNIVFKASGYDEGKTLYLQRQQQVLVSATISPSNATNKVVTWSTSNYDIAVTPNGDRACYITAYDLGTAVITATVGNYSKTIDVECVAKIAPTSITTDVENLEIAIASQREISYTIMPENATNKNVSHLIQGVDNADISMIKVNNENGKIIVLVEQLATIGSKYTLTLRPVDNAALRVVINITVAPLELESISFKNDNVTLSLNDPLYRMLPVYEPLKTSYRDVTFTSSNNDICEVDAIGSLKPKQIGTVIITATSTQNPAISCQATVTINNNESAYLDRLLLKEDVINQEAVTYEMMNFETDKVAFAAWSKVLSEDSNAGSHISDAGWAIWMVGFDTFDDDNSPSGGEVNALTYCKINVPQTATKMQYVLRSHPLPDDYTKFRIKAIDDQLNIVDLTGWVTFHETKDMFINVDVTSYQGKAVTFVLEQDQIGNKLAGSFMNVNLMFRRCAFNSSENELFIEEDEFSILLQGKE